MFRRISTQLIVVVAAISVASIGVFSYFLLAAQKRALITQVEQSAHQLSETIKSSTRSDMLLNQRDAVHRIIDSLGAQEGIEKVRIFNKEGAIIYSGDREAIGRMVDKRAEACYGCHAADRPLEKLSVPQRTRIFVDGGGRTLGIVNPIYNEPGCWQADCHAHTSAQTVLGVLDVTMSLAEADRQIAAGRGRIVLLALSAIVSVSIVLWLALRRLVVRPVSDLVAATRAVADGALGYQIDIGRNDELGELQRSFNEMTRRMQEAQTQIYRSDKLASLGRLAAGIAHEINNPLTGVLTYSSFLLKRAEPESELREDLETIVRETKRCREIVKGLLDFSRQMPSSRSPVEVTRVVERAIRIVRNQLSFDRIDVQRRDAADLPPLKGDENQLLQVLINLLVNAADAIGAGGGTITVETRTTTQSGRPMVQIRVSDSGCGIATDSLGKIFDPFYTTKEHRGTGLGLAVAWGIVEDHGGTITVESEEGQGARFTVHLPVVPPAPLSAPDREAT